MPKTGGIMGRASFLKLPSDRSPAMKARLRGAMVALVVLTAATSPAAGQHIPDFKTRWTLAGCSDEGCHKLRVGILGFDEEWGEWIGVFDLSGEWFVPSMPLSISLAGMDGWNQGWRDHSWFEGDTSISVYQGRYSGWRETFLVDAGFEPYMFDIDALHAPLGGTYSDITHFSTVNLYPVATPEPASLLLLGSGLGAIVFGARRKRRKQVAEL